jgi:hypothetical protein
VPHGTDGGGVAKYGLMGLLSQAQVTSQKICHFLVELSHATLSIKACRVSEQMLRHRSFGESQYGGKHETMACLWPIDQQSTAR